MGGVKWVFVFTYEGRVFCICCPSLSPNLTQPNPNYWYCMVIYMYVDRDMWQRSNVRSATESDLSSPSGGEEIRFSYYKIYWLVLTNNSLMLQHPGTVSNMKLMLPNIVQIAWQLFVTHCGHLKVSLAKWQHIYGLIMPGPACSAN